MKNILAFDVGTTSMKCILYSEGFDELFSKTTEYAIDTRDGIYAEADASIYFDAFMDCIDNIKQKGIDLCGISAICFTTQGETLVPVDNCGNPLSKAIVWLDTRAQKEAEFIKSAISVEEMYKVTGLYDIDGAAPIAKLCHIKQNSPDIYEKTHKFLLLEDYLIFRLTGKFVSEKSLQSSTGWYDITGDRLYDKVLDLCGIDISKLPDILPCGTDVGFVSDWAAKLTGLSQNTRVVTGAMDQIASAIGAGNITEGKLTETTGTALVVGVTVKNPEFDVQNPVTIYRHYNDSFIYMPYFATAGIVHRWFRDTIMPYVKTEAKSRGISPYTLMEESAKLSPAGSNGIIFRPDFSGNGSFSGLSLSVTVSDLARSVQEGIAYVLRDLIESIEIKGVKISEVYSAGGGSYSDFWLGIKSSVLDKTVKTLGYSETTALGAAILAAVSLGVYRDADEALKIVNHHGKTFLPDEADVQIYNKCYEKYKSLK